VVWNLHRILNLHRIQASHEFLDKGVYLESSRIPRTQKIHLPVPPVLRAICTERLLLLEASTLTYAELHEN
jgi:hypothetical protein